MHRIIALATVLLLSTACRAERSWFATIGMARGAACGAWMATQSEDIAQGVDAQNCSAVLASNDEGLDVTIIESDTWAGECWVELELSLASDAPDVTTATFDFAFDLCNEAGGDCPADLQDSEQQRLLTVRADVLEGNVPDGCEG